MGCADDDDFPYTSSPSLLVIAHSERPPTVVARLPPGRLACTLVWKLAEEEDFVR